MSFVLFVILIEKKWIKKFDIDLVYCLFVYFV